MEIKEIKAEIDKITSAAKLNELLEYIEEKRNNLLPTLHKVLEPLFDQHPGTRYCILGGYGAGDYECAGEYYVIDCDPNSILRKLGSSDEKEAKEITKDKLLDCYIEDDSYESFRDLIENTQDFPEITEEAAYRNLRYQQGDETVFIYDYQKNKIIEITYSAW